MRSFESLSEREVLALAIALEEEDAKIYGDFADGLKESYPSSAEVFRRMGAGVDERIYPRMGHTINGDELRAVQGLLSV